MKIKVTRVELINLLAGMEQVKELQGIKLGYACGRNKKLIQEEIELFNKTIAGSDEFKKYDEARKKLCMEYCDHDEQGRPIIINNLYKGVNENPEFIAKIEELKEQNKDVLDQQQKKVDEFNKILVEEKIDFNIYVLAVEDLPPNITVQQMDAIFLMIVENKEDKK